MIPADVTPPCADDPSLFFAETNTSHTAAAKKVCAGCPFGDPCADYAMAYDVSGIWSGTTTAERQRARQRAGIVPVQIVTNPYPRQSRRAAA